MKFALVLAFLAATPALAEAPVTSPAPKANPQATTQAAAIPESKTPDSKPARKPKARPGELSTVVMGGPAFGNGLPALRPRPRPTAAEQAPVVQVAAALSAMPGQVMISPRPRPEGLERRMSLVPVGYRVQPPSSIITGLKGSVCGNPLIRGRTIPPIVSRVRGCGLHDGVEVTSVAGVELGEGAQIDCPTAQALATWVQKGLKPTVGNLGGGVVALETGPTYACRPRNNQKGNRLSEHGRGAALDVMGIRLANGVVLSVLKGWGTQAQGQVLKAVHASACGPFTTVLGPKADRFHDDHFHLDTAKGRGPYCR